MRWRRAVPAFAAGLLGLVLALPVVLLLLPLWTVSAATRWLANRVRRRTVEWEDLVVFDPEMGWRLRPDLDCLVGDDPFRVTTDAEGWRGRSTTVDGADVVAIGDSYAFGFGVDDSEFFAELPGEVRLKGVGAPGYGMVHELLWLRRLAPRLRGKRVVWLVYLGNDLDDALQPAMYPYRSPFVREAPGTGRWEIVDEHLDPSPWPIPRSTNNYKRYVDICRPSYLSRRVFSACEHLIREGARTCREAGAELTVMTIPDLSPAVTRQFEAHLAERPDVEGFDPELPDRELASICGDLGVRFVPLRRHLDERHYLRTDGHWNARGHRRVAEVLSRLHEETEAFSTPARPGADRTPSPPRQVVAGG